MKTLLLLRHAHAPGGVSHLPDHERPLSDRGRREAGAVAEHLRRQGFHPQRILASAARRARETAWAAAGQGSKVSEAWSLYGAGPGVILEILRELPDTVDCALVVAHNPGLEEVLQHMTGDRRPMPPATLVRIRLELERWRDLGEATSGRLEESWRAPPG